MNSIFIRTLIGSLCFIASTAYADGGFYKIQCSDENGRSLFAGLIETMQSPKATTNAQISYFRAISAEPVATLDRMSLQRRLGLESRGCMGPYAKVFVIIERNGSLNCHKLKATKLEKYDRSPRESFIALEVPENERPCSVLLDRDSIRKLDLK